ncbi:MULTISPECIES: hypothetical protein [unclassified Nonomuraea]|uniref:hypothetical protein n=1 Tax=unclassified Nonomuraea TaxID=2593643 RepID=UPI0033E3E78F
MPTSGRAHCNTAYGEMDIGYQGGAEIRLKSDDWIDFFGRMGNPSAGDQMFMRREGDFPAGTTGTIGYGFTFTGGTPVIVATMFNVFGPHGVCINSRHDGGFGFSTTTGTPGADYRVMYWVWKQ